MPLGIEVIRSHALWTLYFLGRRRTLDILEYHHHLFRPYSIFHQKTSLAPWIWPCVVTVLFVDEEGSELCRILANKHRNWGANLKGDVVLNGIM